MAVLRRGRATTIDVGDSDAVAYLFSQVQQDPDRYYPDLYRAFWPTAYRVSFGILRNQQDAEDAAQIALVRAFTKRDSLKNPQAAQKWLYRVIGNTALNYSRDEQRNDSFEEADMDSGSITKRLDEATDYPEQNASHLLPDELVIRREVCEIVFDLVKELPTRQRQAVILYYYADLSTKEVAEALDMNENAVRAALFRARETLNVRIEETEETKGIKLYSVTAVPLAKLLKPSIDAIDIPEVPDEFRAKGWWQTFKSTKPTRRMVALATGAVLLIAGGAFVVSHLSHEDAPAEIAAISALDDDAANAARDTSDQTVSTESTEEDTDATETPRRGTTDQPGSTSSADWPGANGSPGSTSGGSSDTGSSSTWTEIAPSLPRPPYPPHPLPPPLPIEYPRMPDLSSLVRFGTAGSPPVLWQVTARTDATLTLTALQNVSDVDSMLTVAERATIVSQTPGIRPSLELDASKLHFVFTDGYCYAETL